MSGSCVQSVDQQAAGSVKVYFQCTGDASSGSIPDQVMRQDIFDTIRDSHYLYTVSAYPTPGGTAPGTANVQVKESGLDLLGTKGNSLITASAQVSTFPYNAFTATYWYPPVKSIPTVSVTGESTASCNYTIVLDYER